MSGTDPYIGGTFAGNYKRTSLPSATLTTSYQLLMRENASRKGFGIEADPDNTTNIFVRFGTDGVEWEISPGGALNRNFKTGSVWSGSIYIKGASGSEGYYAEEN